MNMNRRTMGLDAGGISPPPDGRQMTRQVSPHRLASSKRSAMRHVPVCAVLRGKG